MADGLMELLGILMRWVHVASAALLAGGMFYARFVSDDGLCAPRPRLRLWIWGSVAGLTFSGLYNLHAATGHSRFYYVWLLVKILLALHVFVSAALALACSDGAQRRRRTANAALSSLAILLIAAYLRRIY